jgi:hypothetical protein
MGLQTAPFGRGSIAFSCCRAGTKGSGVWTVHNYRARRRKTLVSILPTQSASVQFVTTAVLPSEYVIVPEPD